MGRIRVFIYTHNQKYGERIVRYAVSRNHPEILFEQLTEITDKTELQKNDFVASDDSKLLHKLACHKIRIVRRREEEGKENIFMYQDRESIYHRLLVLVGANEKDGESSGIGRYGSKLVCVFSPGGGDEKTLLAIHHALGCAEKGRVLYISLCGFPVFFRQEISRAPTAVNAGVSELFLCTRLEEFEQRLTQLSFPISSVNMIPPVEHYKDLLDFSREEVVRFMEHLREQNLYDRVVLEVGQLFEYTFDLLECAEKILLPLEPGFLAEVRRHVFRQYCRMEEKEHIWEQIETIPVSFRTPEDIDEVNRLFFGEEGENEPGGKAKKGTNPESRIESGSTGSGA